MVEGAGVSLDVYSFSRHIRRAVFLLFGYLEEEEEGGSSVASGITG